MPHVPLFASEKFKDTSARGLYGDVIEEIDWSVGQILDTLRERRWLPENNRTQFGKNRFQSENGEVTKMTRANEATAGAWQRRSESHPQTFARSPATGQNSPA